MGWESWLIAISVLIIALAFVALAIFIISTLLSLKHMVNDLDLKVRALDPIFRVVNQAGHAIERKAAQVEHFSNEVEQSVYKKLEQKKESTVGLAVEVAEIAILGLSLWQKIQERKRR